MVKKRISSIRHRVIAGLLILFDIIATFAVYWLALYISFECEAGSIPARTFEIYYKSYNINKLPLMIDYLIREEITTEAQAISSLAKSFGATYSIGLEKKKIYLVPVFE